MPLRSQDLYHAQDDAIHNNKPIFISSILTLVVWNNTVYSRIEFYAARRCSSPVDALK